MQWLSKNTVIITLFISLVSLLLIKIEIKPVLDVSDKIIIVKNKVESKSLTQDQAPPDQTHKGINKVNQKPVWNDRQIIDQLNRKDSLILLQTLSHIWIHIDDYSKHDEIMKHVRLLTRHINDNRISGLASLVSGERVQQDNLKKEMTEPSNNWEDLEQGRLVRQEDQSDSEYENLDLYSVDNIKRDSAYSEDRIEYIDGILSHKDDSNIHELATLILDTDEEVSIAAIDTLIVFLEQGVGDPDEVGALLEENIAFLDELQVQRIEELSGDSVN